VIEDGSGQDQEDQEGCNDGDIEEEEIRDAKGI
jgi:hypothetical protein